jgi:hypothetical protein
MYENGLIRTSRFAALQPVFNQAGKAAAFNTQLPYQP